MTGKEIYNAYAGCETIEAVFEVATLVHERERIWLPVKISRWQIRNVDPPLYEIEVMNVMPPYIRQSLQVGEGTSLLRRRYEK